MEWNEQHLKAARNSNLINVPSIIILLNRRDIYLQFLQSNLIITLNGTIVSIVDSMCIFNIVLWSYEASWPNDANGYCIAAGIKSSFDPLGVTSYKHTGKCSQTIQIINFNFTLQPPAFAFNQRDGQINNGKCRKNYSITIINKFYTVKWLEFHIVNQIICHQA